MRRSIVCGILLAGALGCASAPQEQEPAWLTQARAREADPLPAREIAAQGSFRSLVPAEVLVPPRRDGETHVFALGIGSEAAAECWVHDSDLDLATSLAAFSEATFGAISQQFGEVELRRIEGVDAGSLAGGAFLALDWLYRVGSGSQARIGQIKHLAVSKDDHTLYCQHNELGYEATFRRVVEGLVRELAFPAAPPRRPYYEEISVFAVRDMRVGVQHVELARDEEGDTRIDLRSSMLIPVDESTLQTNDTYGLEFARPDGTLINQVHVEVENGKLVTQLELDPEADGSWRAHGTFQTKQIDARIDAPQALGSWLGEVLSLRRGIEQQGVGGEVVMVRWMPDADPTRFLEERIAIRERAPGGRFRTTLSVAGLEAEALADRAGTTASGSVDLGHVQMRFERIFADGRL
jgi:hypothetical protein